MEQYYKTYEIRWSDLDPNRHLATHTRFNLLNENGFGQNEFAKHQFGPIVFGEEIAYFKEVLFGETIFVDFEVSGMTHDGRFYQFRQGFYKWKISRLADSPWKLDKPSNLETRHHSNASDRKRFCTS
ncbi:MAG: acyl-CoA thioester hydrolase [Arenicella sp.]|jgi:acyl-CoA thioester hydrolase